MSGIYMTLCDSCAEKMDAGKHPENPYYMDEVLGSRRIMQCTKCFRTAECAKYSAKSKEIVAMERAIERRRQQGGVRRDRRPRYHEPWRGS